MQPYQSSTTSPSPNPGANPYDISAARSYDSYAFDDLSAYSNCDKNNMPTPASPGTHASAPTQSSSQPTSGAPKIPSEVGTRPRARTKSSDYMKSEVEKSDIHTGLERYAAHKALKLLDQTVAGLGPDAISRTTTTRKVIVKEEGESFETIADLKCQLDLDRQSWAEKRALSLLESMAANVV